MLTISKKSVNDNVCKKMPRFKSLIKTIVVMPALVISAIAFTHKPALAADNCPSQVHNSAYNYANKIVTDPKQLYFLIPVNLRTSVEECTYFADEGAFILYMRVNWQHPWENKPYSAIVRVQSMSNGSWSWNLQEANPNLWEHIVTVGLLEALSKQ